MTGVINLALPLLCNLQLCVFDTWLIADLNFIQQSNDDHLVNMEAKAKLIQSVLSQVFFARWD